MPNPQKDEKNPRIAPEKTRPIGPPASWPADKPQPSQKTQPGSPGKSKESCNPCNPKKPCG